MLPESHSLSRESLARFRREAQILAKLSAAAFVEMSTTCGGQRIIRLRATAQRRIRDDDTWNLREAGGWQRNRSG